MVLRRVHLPLSLLILPWLLVNKWCYCRSWYAVWESSWAEVSCWMQTGGSRAYLLLLDFQDRKSSNSPVEKTLLRAQLQPKYFYYLQFHELQESYVIIACFINIFHKLWTAINISKFYGKKMNWNIRDEPPPPKDYSKCNIDDLAIGTPSISVYGDIFRDELDIHVGSFCCALGYGSAFMAKLIVSLLTLEKATEWS
ncbi:hypothetical protein KIW84_054074 [Lathyrus oleraceus]|uniref:Uncharacterized protein n=1 Tax=Pisum sativum TaxID=3888 RepID=A0A9D5AHP0_PEA|nr:hypothetical protein KIW84_054074 [Pisum sativum]